MKGRGSKNSAYHLLCFCSVLFFLLCFSVLFCFCSVLDRRLFMLVSWPPRLFCPFSTSMSSSSSSLPALRFRPLHVTMERRERSSVVISSANSLGDPLASPNHDQTHELSSSTGVVPLTPPISIKLWNLPDHHLLLLSTVACMVRLF